MPGYLSETKQAGKVDLPRLADRVVKQGGPGAYRQFLALLWLLIRKSGPNFDEYYTYGLWRKNLDPRFLKEFLPKSGLKAFNTALEMPSLGLAHDLIDDKVATEQLLNARGLRTTRTLAAFGGAQVAPPIRPLPDAAAIVAFLADPPELPLFGKPQNDSFARGAVAIKEVSEDRQTVTFLNGKTAPIAALAEEIVTDWPKKGYIFQPQYRCHQDLRRHVGEAMASVRIVTLRTDRGVEPYYAVLRIPAKKAMHDGDAFGTRIWGLIDHSTGALVKLRNLRDPVTPDVTHWLDPSEPLLGFVMPHWPQAMRAVLDGHEAFPGHGILGWDVFLTDEGALLNEVNARPGHVYQAAAARGLRNPDLEPAYQRALAHAKAVNGAQAG